MDQVQTDVMLWVKLKAEPFDGLLYLSNDNS